MHTRRDGAFFSNPNFWNLYTDILNPLKISFKTSAKNDNRKYTKKTKLNILKEWTNSSLTSRRV